VPSGTQSFNVASTANLSAGDRIIVHRTPNQTWIDLLSMAQYGWTPGSYNSESPRVITAINGNTITIDAPLTHAIESQYGGGEVYRYHFNGALRQIGIENIRLESSFTSATDEDHGWNAVVFRQAENGWARRVTARHFGFSCVDIGNHSQFITVEDCAQLDPKSQVTGGRRYSFNLDNSSFVLMQRCYTRGGRHDYVTGSKTVGPNVFVDSLAENTNSDIGPHQRYAEGLLFDNLRGGEMNVQNRADSGSGHGWAGAQTVFWNCDATTMICDAPAAAMNFSIGNIATQEEGFWVPSEPEGIWESRGTPVTPRSLYYSQLEDRLDASAVATVTAANQQTGTIWSDLSAWKGDSDAPGLPVFYPVRANAGTDAGVVGDSYDLAATVRYPLPDEFAITKNWTQVSGQYDAMLSNPSSLSTTVTFPAPGIYEFQFTASQTDARDPQNTITYTGSDTVVVTVIESAFATVNPSSIDKIIGRRQDSAEPLGYYAGVSGLSGDTIGGSGSAFSQERTDQDIVLGYTLPNLPAGKILSGATLHFEITGKRNDSGDDPGLDVYLLDTAAPENSGAAFFYRGENDPNPDAVKVDGLNIPTASDVSFPSGTQVQSFTLSGDALALLQSFYAADGTPNQTEAFFRFNLDNFASGSNIKLDRYFIDSSAASLELFPAPENTFANWISVFNIDPSQQGPGDDPDADGISNALENFFGTHPGESSGGISGLELLPGINALDFFEDFNDMNTFQEPTGTTNLSSGGNSEILVVPGDPSNPINGTNALRIDNFDESRAPILEWDLARPVSAAEFSFDYHVTTDGGAGSGNGSSIYVSMGRQAGSANSLNSSAPRLSFASFSDDGTIDYDAGDSSHRLLNQPLTLNQDGNLTVFVNDFDALPISFLNPQTNTADTLAPNSVVFFLNNLEVFRGGLADRDLGGGLISESEDNIGRIAFTGLSFQFGIRMFVDNISVTPISFFTFTHPHNPQVADDLSVTYKWSTDLEQFHGHGDTNANGTTVSFDTSTSNGLTTVYSTISGSATDQLFILIEVLLD
jgi:hypothetical protein